MSKLKVICDDCSLIDEVEASDKDIAAYHAGAVIWLCGSIADCKSGAWRNKDEGFYKTRIRTRGRDRKKLFAEVLAFRDQHGIVPVPGKGGKRYGIQVIPEKRVRRDIPIWLNSPKFEQFLRAVFPGMRTDRRQLSEATRVGALLRSYYLDGLTEADAAREAGLLVDTLKGDITRWTARGDAWMATGAVPDYRKILLQRRGAGAPLPAPDEGRPTMIVDEGLREYVEARWVRNGFTVDDLAVLCSVEPRMLAAWYAGNVRLPDEFVAENVSSVLQELEAAILLEDPDAPYPRTASGAVKALKLYLDYADPLEPAASLVPVQEPEAPTGPADILPSDDRWSKR